MSPGRAAAALVTAAALACSSAEAQSVTDSATVAGVPDAIIVELALGRYVSRTVPAYRSGDEALLPLTQFADLAEIATRRCPRAEWSWSSSRGTTSVAIDPASAEIRAGQRQRQPRRRRPGRPGRRSVPEHAGARRPPALELHHQLERSERRAHRRGQPAGGAADDSREGRGRLSRGRRRAQRPTSRWEPTGRAGTAWCSTIRCSRRARTCSAAPTRPALGMNLMGGSLEATRRQRRAAAGRQRPLRRIVDRRVANESRGLRSSAWATGSPAARGPRAVRGFAISNVPFLRPALFGDIPFQGGLGPGWQIEAYRGGRLLAIDSADGLGRFSLDVPVEYGENPVDFVAYGPFGEVRQFNQTYRVVSDVIPARRLEYGVSLGGCRSATCRANGNLDVRYGLSPRWTVRGGMDQFWRDTLPALSHPYVGVAGAIGNAWALEFEGVAAAVVRGAARYEPSQNIRISTEFNRFATGPVQPILTPQGRLTQWTTSAMARPFRRRDDVYVDASLDRITATTGRRDQRPTRGLVVHLPVCGWRRRSGSRASATRSVWRAPSRSCRSTPFRCHSPSWARSSVASPGARRGNWTPTAARRRWRRTCRASWATP